MTDPTGDPAATGEPIIIVIDPDDPHPWRTIRPQLMRAIAYLDTLADYEPPPPPRLATPEAPPGPYRPPWDDPPEETDPWAEPGPTRM